MMVQSLASSIMHIGIVVNLVLERLNEKHNKGANDER